MTLANISIFLTIDQVMYFKTGTRVFWLRMINTFYHQCLDEFGTPENICNADYNQLIQVSGIGSATANMILKSKSIDSSKVILDKCFNNCIKITTCNDKIHGIIECITMLEIEGIIKSLHGGRYAIS